MTLDSRFDVGPGHTPSPEMVALMSAYQDQLKQMGLSGLGIRPLPHPLKATNGDYVGSAACQNCHEESYRIWKKTPHSHAFATLKNALPPRNFDPGMHQLPHRRLEPHEILPVPERVSQRRGDAQADERRLRGLPRSRPAALLG